MSDRYREKQTLCFSTNSPYSLFEGHFDLKGRGIGAVALLLKKTQDENKALRRLVSYLVLFINDLRRKALLKKRWLYRAVSEAEELVDAKSLKQLEQAEKHDW